MTEGWHNFPDPGLIAQHDGSPFEWENCAPSTWAALVVAQMQGKRPAKGSPWFPTGASLRTQSGDRSGGILPSVLDATVNRIYGIDLDVRITGTAAVQSALEHGFDVGVLVGYGPIADHGDSGSPGFRGNHSLPLFGTRTISSVVEWLSGDPLYDGRRGVIPKGPRWIPRSVIVKACEALVVGDQTMRQRYDQARLYAVFDTRAYIAQHYRVHIGARGFWSYNVVNDVITSRKWLETGGLSASSTGPRTRPFPKVSKRYSLVQLTSGSLYEKYKKLGRGIWLPSTFAEVVS